MSVLEKLRDGQAHYESTLIEGATSETLNLFRDAADEIELLARLLGEEKSKNLAFRARVGLLEALIAALEK